MLTERIFCLLIAGLGGAALLRASRILRGEYNKGMFVFYTSQSNLLMVLFHALLFGVSFAPQSTLYAFLSAPWVRIIVVTCITITFVVYHFILTPGYKRDHPDRFRQEYFTFDNLTVHYAVPWLVILCWAICAEKNAPLWSAAAWLALPLAYVAYALLRGRFGGTMNGRPDGPRYPYPFLDAEALGPKGLAKNLVIYLAAFYLVGLAYVGVSKVLSLL
ncbi:MAG: Pr6Pr family membrane protein [Oscillospiraceae bacterium]|nr:Pr6Pr family membrane protein [Oscillospiraceae bacterium]